MNAQSPQSPGLRTKSGEEGRFRELVNQQVPRPGPGVVHTTLPGGTVLTPLRTRGRSSAAPDNFHATVFTQAGKKKIRVANGQIAGLTPTLDGTALDKKTEEKLPPSLEITGIGIEKIYAIVTAAHTATLGWVHTTVVTDIEIDVFTEDQESDLTTFYPILIATIEDGKVQHPQPVRSSLSFRWSSHGSATSKATLQTEAT